MELLDGRDLRQLLDDEKQLDPVRAAAIGVQACRALQESHAKGVIHRDLKPANLFVSQRWDGTDHVKLLDFGVAKLVRSSDVTVGSTDGGPIGTVSYMAPEQARGASCVDHRIDIYALGVILYEALLGRHPCPARDRHAVLHHLLFEVPVPLSQDPAIPPDLCAVVHRALAYSPEHRFQSAAEFSDALLSFIHASARRSEAGSDPRSSTRDRPMAIIAAAVAAAMMGGVASAPQREANAHTPVRSRTIGSSPSAIPRLDDAMVPSPPQAVDQKPALGKSVVSAQPPKASHSSPKRNVEATTPRRKVVSFDLTNPYDGVP